MQKEKGGFKLAQWPFLQAWKIKSEDRDKKTLILQICILQLQFHLSIDVPWPLGSLVTKQQNLSTINSIKMK
jgi:hypothetical protein